MRDRASFLRCSYIRHTQPRGSRNKKRQSCSRAAFSRCLFRSALWGLGRGVSRKWVKVFFWKFLVFVWRLFIYSFGRVEKKPLRPRTWISSQLSKPLSSSAIVLSVYAHKSGFYKSHPSPNRPSINSLTPFSANSGISLTSNSSAMPYTTCLLQYASPKTSNTSSTSFAITPSSLVLK